MFKQKMCSLFKYPNIDEKYLKYYCAKYPHWSDNNFSILPITSNTNNSTNYNNTLEIIYKNNDTHIITIWTQVDIDIVEKYLTNVGANIFHKMNVKLSRKGLENLLYQLYADSENIINIKSLIDENYNGDIIILFFQNTRKEFIELIRLSINEIISKKNCLTISDTYFTTICTARLYLNKNSIDFLEKQNLDNFTKPAMKKSRVMFATFRKWLFSNCSIIEQENFILFSGSILYCLGIRKINDLDLYISNKSAFIDIFIDKAFPFIDSTIKNTPLWKPHWNNWEKEWLSKVGEETFEDIMTNDEHHFYFLGVKFMTLQCDLYRRQKRNRPKSFCDLIKINNIIRINIPKIPTTKKIFVKTNDPDSIEDKGENWTYDKELGELTILKPIDRNDFINTMIKYFKYSYDEEWTVEMINNHLPTIKKKIIRQKK